jgi:glycosyltransferase involved in cell wall biosynthesis
LVEVPAEIKVTDLIFNYLFSKLPYNATRFLNIDFSRKLIELFKTNEFDIVQLEGLYVCPYIDLIRRHSNATIVYRSHNIEHEIWLRTAKQSKGLKHLYLRNLSKRIKKMELDYLNRYDILVPITQRDNEFYSRIGNQKPSLAIPAGIDISEEIFPTDKVTDNLFFIGALDWSPNQEGLIWFIEKCWPQILKKRAYTKLIVAGRNAPAWFVEKIKVEGLNYIGEVENAHNFMLENKIMIVPLLSGGGMRVKIVEGMSLKKPIVTTIVGCEGIDAVHHRDIMISANESEFVSNTLELMDDIQLQTEISGNSYKFVRENYSNEALINRLILFYKNHFR